MGSLSCLNNRGCHVGWQIIQKNSAVAKRGIQYLLHLFFFGLTAKDPLWSGLFTWWKLVHEKVRKIVIKIWSFCSSAADPQAAVIMSILSAGQQIPEARIYSDVITWLEFAFCWCFGCFRDYANWFMLWVRLPDLLEEDRRDICLSLDWNSESVKWSCALPLLNKPAAFLTNLLWRCYLNIFSSYGKQTMKILWKRLYAWK